MTMRNLLLLVMLLCLFPAAVINAQPASQPPAAPDEMAGDTSDIKQSPAAPAPTPTAPSPAKDGAAAPAAGPIAPEQYFQLLLERQRLSIDYYREVHKALDANAKDQKAAMKTLDALESERRKRSQALFEKYGITEDQYLLPTVGSEAQAQRSKYLDEHPEVRDQISANSKELKSLENKAQDRINQLLGRPAPDNQRRPKK